MKFQRIQRFIQRVDDMFPFFNIMMSTPMAILGGILIYYMVEVPIINKEKQ